MAHLNSYTPYDNVVVFKDQRPGKTVEVETAKEAIDTYWTHSGQRVKYITIDGRDYYLFFGHQLSAYPVIRDAIIEKYGPSYGPRWAFWAVRDGRDVADVVENQELRRRHGCIASY